MKRFSSKTRGRSRLISRIKVPLIVSAGLLISFLLLPTLFQILGTTVMYPVHITRVWLAESTDSLPSYLREKRVLIEEIHSLEQQVAERSGAQVSLELIRSENRQLRELLELPDNERRHLARVVARPESLPYDVLQIDAGGRDGVIPNAPVYHGAGQVIGFVSYVAPYYSLVTLVTSPEQKGTAFVFGPDIYARTEGMGGGVLRVRIPQGVSVAKNDIVVLPAAVSGYYGKISHIETRPTEPQQYAYVPLDTSLQSIRYVSVGLDPISPLDFTTVQKRVDTASSTIFLVDVPPAMEEIEWATSTEDGSVDLDLGQHIATSTDVIP